MATFVRKHKSAHKKPISPLTPTSEIDDPKNIHARKLQFEYTNQHSRWSELRDRMKSMQLNRIQVTSYRNRNSYSQNKHLENFKSEPKLSVNLNNKNNKNTQTQQNELFNKLDLKNIGTQRIFSSNTKKNQRKFNKNLPYYQAIYKRQEKNKLQMSLRNLQSDQKQAMVGQNPQNQFNSNQISKNINEMAKQNKIRNKSGKHRNRHCRTSASHHKNNSNKIYNDLIYFNQIQPEDYTQRMVVRRKSNVIGDCIQAIEASILRGKIILFIVDVTTGSPKTKETPSQRTSHKKISNSLQVIRQKNQMNSSAASSIPFQSHQSQLLMGPNQIIQYLQMIGLSSHPVELESSTVKLASILVDFLIIEEATLRFDKNQVGLFFVNSNNNENKQQVMKQAQILLSKSQLVRLLNPHKRKGHNKTKYDLSQTHNNIKSENSKQMHDRMEYYKVYGHPHPVINSQQYEQIVQFQENHPQTQQKRIQSGKQSKRSKGQISQQIAPNSTEIRNIEQNAHQILQNMQNSNDVNVLLPKTIEHKQNEQIVEQNSQFIQSQNLKSDRIMEESHIQQMRNSSLKEQIVSRAEDQIQNN